MVAALLDIAPSSRPMGPAWQRLPHCMKVLHICSRPGAGTWLGEALAADSASKVVLAEAVGTAAGLSRLRDEVFDAILVSHEPGELDALDLVEGYRAGGAEDPIVVLGSQSEAELAALCYEVGADGYVCIGTTTRNLIWVVARAIQRHQLVEENQRLNLDQQTRRQRECEETACILEQQRALLKEGSELFSGPTEGSPGKIVLTPFYAHYRELLRTYVIMGSGNLSDELGSLAQVLVAADVTAGEVLQLHLQVLEELVQGLGTRSARHVMIRADLLVLELLVYLTNGYRRRHLEYVHSPVQQVLPGF